MTALLILHISPYQYNGEYGEDDLQHEIHSEIVQIDSIF